MANTDIDPKTGFCSNYRTFYSLRPNVPLPPPSEPLSLIDYALSLLPSTATTNNTPALIDSATDHHLSYSLFLHQVKSLAYYLQSRTSLSKGHVAFILAPSSLHVPVLYFSLISLGVTVAPANPLSSPSEINHLVQLTKPSIAFATSATATNIPNLPLGTILVDSPSFLSMLDCKGEPRRVETSQSDSAAILFSSGTTGRIKGALLTHRNLISLIAGFCHLKHVMESDEDEPHPVSLFTLPLYHVFGFFMMVRALAMGETLVLMQRFDFERMLKAVERYKITYMPVSPPLITALVKSELVKKYDFSSIRLLGSGGAPLGKEIVESFKAKFPNVEIVQVTNKVTFTLTSHFFLLSIIVYSRFRNNKNNKENKFLVNFRIQRLENLNWGCIKLNYASLANYLFKEIFTLVFYDAVFVDYTTNLGLILFFKVL